MGRVWSWPDGLRDRQRPWQHAAAMFRLSAGSALTLASFAIGQCPRTPLPGAVPGTDGLVYASTWWDPDGTGPLTPRIVVGGAFRVTDTLAARNIAALDPSTGTWSTFNSGLGDDFSQVYALAVLADGSLVAGGSFTTAGGSPLRRIARWNGSAWTALAAGMDAPVYALTTLTNGDLLAGGVFTTAGATSAAALAKWDGSSWSRFTPTTVITSGFAQTSVSTIRELTNGDLVIGGLFHNVGGVFVANIARWDGSNWSALGSGTSNQVLTCLQLASGDLVVGGDFLQAGGQPCARIARWNGSTWSPIGTGFAPAIVARVHMLRQLGNGDLVASGVIDLAGTVSTQGLARFDGVAWAPFGGGLRTGSNTTGVAYTSQLLGNGDLWIGGSFAQAGGTLAGSVASWNGTNWHRYGDGTNGSVATLHTAADGTVYGGGDFTLIDGVPAKYIARRTANGWQALGAGTNSGVRALLSLANGELLVGGNFTSAGGVACSRVARWNGTSWSPLGSGLDNEVHAFAELQNGDLIAAGSFSTVSGAPANGLARWDGNAWTAVVAPASWRFFNTSCLVRLPGGELIAPFQSGSGGSNVVASWNGTAWTQLGGALPQTGGCVLLLASGQLLAAASIWNGSAWQPLGVGPVGYIRSLLQLPDGDILATVDQSTNADGALHRWNGNAWTQITTIDRTGFAVALSPQGELLLGGNHRRVDNVMAPFLTQLPPGCPATAVAINPGCNGSTGPVTLVAEALPWLATTAISRAEGVPPGALTIEVVGMAATASTLPLGAAGCSLWVAPMATFLRLPDANGSVLIQQIVPATPTLLGAQFRQQLVVAEIDAYGAVAVVTASNDLLLTIGAL